MKKLISIVFIVLAGCSSKPDRSKFILPSSLKLHYNGVGYVIQDSTGNLLGRGVLGNSIVWNMAPFTSLYRYCFDDSVKAKEAAYYYLFDNIGQ